MPKRYLHEIWLSPDEDGQLLPSCIPLGPSGDAARNMNEPGILHAGVQKFDCTLL